MYNHLIYTVTKRLINHVVWQETPDVGWLYCGLSDDLKTDLLIECINTHFFRPSGVNLNLPLKKSVHAGSAVCGFAPG